MKSIRTLILACTVAAVAGCSNSYLDDTNSVDLGGSGVGGAAGSSADPRSPAYFQEAIGDRVLFAVDQSTLDDAGRVLLTAQADWLMSNTDYTAVIEGHADEQGTREYNLALGARRANAVREYLVSRGVSGARLKTVSFGKERPLEICSAESCYAKNRRAVTVLAGGLTG
ncbi:peptidoglycan-associated lipoprotein Pal [Antarcticimicrobium sediminis]|uniref:Peptidoglycan-associated lipoprotein n=1 Tax=Antarcticimicrobium sediminis TaxID=2546227 RepID=A0A4R5EXJ8_9RHOB|nr:peptidoglycan-associated lipoprotein Pal [Antarcticimicrobium sediminis]TDE39711.1 peptidoglycan-associated lipoprotein Pal [Antarcticimicrobium sediminis]